MIDLKYIFKTQGPIANEAIPAHPAIADDQAGERPDNRDLTTVPGAGAINLDGGISNADRVFRQETATNSDGVAGGHRLWLASSACKIWDVRASGNRRSPGALGEAATDITINPSFVPVRPNDAELRVDCGWFRTRNALFVRSVGLSRKHVREIARRRGIRVHG